MLKRITRGFITILGAGIGVGIVALIYQLLFYFKIIDHTSGYPGIISLIIYGVGAAVAGLISFITAPKIMERFFYFASWVENKLLKVPIADLISGVTGLLVGLVLAMLISNIFSDIPLGWVKVGLTAITYILFGYIGLAVTIKRKSEISFLHGFKRSDRADRADKKERSRLLAAPKILDTSVIIDGRIFDICQTGLIEGTLIIPGFVLQELRHIADSADALKRNRGRRGLDVLKKIQKELDMNIQILEKDYENTAEVDAKLLKLAKELGGKVVTNDYNLNKVADVQGVEVFNINELANALKPVVLPGEDMRVTVVKQGKEPGQGIAYLDDGTMIVVEEGRSQLGEEADVTVTSVLQTSAGRMIFAKIKD
ncbi:MAG: PIN/TRAM domain-containing protein [Christensenellales bacterium]|jgi:uncharacterized protein YacL